MNYIQHLQESYGYAVLLPILFVAGTFLFAGVFRFALWIAAVVFALPMLLPYLDLPLDENFMREHPLVLVAAGAAVVLAFAIGRVLMRPILKSEKGEAAGAGPLRVIYFFGLLAALSIVTLLYTQPAALEKYAPGWKGAAGMVLLCMTLLSAVTSVLRAFKSAFVIAIWSFVSLVLASEIFLNKLPQEIEREDVEKFLEIPRSKVEEAVDKLKLAWEDQEALKISFVGSESVLGIPYATGHSYPDRIKSILNSNPILPRVDIQSAAVPGASIYQIERIIREKVLPTKPDIVVVSAGFHDSLHSGNSFDLGNRSEIEAARTTHNRQVLASYRWGAPIVTSKLYRYGEVLTEANRNRSEAPARVDPQYFQHALYQLMGEIRAAGAEPVLVQDPVELSAQSDELRNYRKIVKRVALETNVPLATLEQSEQSMENGEYPFLRTQLLSESGHDLMAVQVMKAMTDLAEPEVRQAAAELR